MYFAATIYYCVAHVLDYTRQLVRTDMRMGVGEYCRRCPVLAEHIEYFAYVAAFLAARVQLSVRLCSCPTLAKAIVALRVYLVCFGD